MHLAPPSQLTEVRRQEEEINAHFITGSSCLGGCESGGLAVPKYQESSLGNELKQTRVSAPSSSEERAPVKSGHPRGHQFTYMSTRSCALRTTLSLTHLREQSTETPTQALRANV